MDKTEQQELPAGEQPLPKDVQPKQPTAIEAATALADRIDAANKESREILERQEALRAEQLLGGQSEAGQQPEVPKEETPKEYTDRIMRGDLKNEEGK